MRKEEREEFTKQGYSPEAISAVDKAILRQSLVNALRFCLSVPGIMGDPDLGAVILKYNHEKTLKAGRQALEKYYPTIPPSQILISRK